MFCLDKMYAILSYLFIYFLTPNMDYSVDWVFFLIANLLTYMY